ncbi:MAG: hypothetical protein ACJ786_36030 [Catenulispora sp.]|jgi:hypothetical protein
MGSRRRTTTKTYTSIGLHADEMDYVRRVMAQHRCSQSAAVGMLIRNGAPHTPMADPSPPEPKDDTP